MGLVYPGVGVSLSYLATLVYLLLFTEGFRFVYGQIDPEINQTAYEIIESKGYQADEYKVETEDGYFLTIQRIRSKVNASQNITNVKRVALLQHGIVDSSYTWINNPANESLGFILADAGYDVWLGNSRGNVYAEENAYLDPNDDAFWAFSWDEMAKYDLPATINFILNETGVNKIYYVGHSQGATIALARFNTDQALREHVAGFAALAPAVYLGDVSGSLRYIASFCQSFPAAGIVFGGRGRFLPPNWLTRILAVSVCSAGSLPAAICENLALLVTGYNPQNLNETRLPVYLAHFPAGTSVQNAVHYCQSASQGRFKTLDFGSASANLAKYNRTTPPPYGLTESALNLPTRVYWGGMDRLVPRSGVMQLLCELTADPRIKDVSSVYLEEYNHLDFIWGIDAPRRVYADIINFFEPL